MKEAIRVLRAAFLTCARHRDGEVCAAAAEALAASGARGQRYEEVPTRNDSKLCFIT